MKRRMNAIGARRAAFAAVAALAALVAIANPARAIFAVTEPWVRADANGQRADVFMQVRSAFATLRNNS